MHHVRVLPGSGTLREFEKFGRSVAADLHEFTDRLPHELVSLDVLRRQPLSRTEGCHGFPT
jgi:hypothetical protein